jgi:glyoxylase-like metal-dependent hydrolase (beta-lactamase superfamily II)
VILLSALNASQWTGPTGNNTYLFPGQHPALIDAGIGHPDHVGSIERELRGWELGLVLITHRHSDHVGGVPALQARWPAIQIAAMSADAGLEAHRTLRDGERIELDDAVLRVIATPGHSPDHCCLFDESSGDLYCGDLVRAAGTIVIAATRGGDLRKYLDSLARVRAIGARRFLPGHGPAIEDPAAIIDRYVRHRAERERQVLDALAQGSRTPSEIASRIYAGLNAALVGAANDTVLAHLIKLREENRAHDENGIWTLS